MAADPACPRCGTWEQVMPSWTEPGRWMCLGCAQLFDSPADPSVSLAACPHDPAQYVTAGEGTAYCPACEAEARERELAVPCREPERSALVDGEGVPAAVSPADTIRRHYTKVCRCEWNDEGPAGGSRETTNAECVIHGSAPDPLDVLLAVGERDKAEIEQLRATLEAQIRVCELSQAEEVRLQEVGERDRQQIAQLTEAAARALITVEIAYDYVLDVRNGRVHPEGWQGQQSAIVLNELRAARAVLAGEEGAADAELLAAGVEFDLHLNVPPEKTLHRRGRIRSVRKDAREGSRD